MSNVKHFFTIFMAISMGGLVSGMIGMRIPVMTGYGGWMLGFFGCVCGFLAYVALYCYLYFKIKKEING